MRNMKNEFMVLMFEPNEFEWTELNNRRPFESLEEAEAYIMLLIEDGYVRKFKIETLYVRS